MSTKVYVGERDGDGVGRVFVEEFKDGASKRRALKHVVRHSPTGLNWGYAGSGPADLASSILADMLEVPGVSPRMYQQFKFDMIVGLKSDGFRLPAEDVQQWLQKRWVNMEHDAIQADFVTG